MGLSQEAEDSTKSCNTQVEETEFLRRTQGVFNHKEH